MKTVEEQAQARRQKYARRQKAIIILPEVFEELMEYHELLKSAQESFDESKTLFISVLKQAKATTYAGDRGNVSLVNQLRLEWDAKKLEKKLPKPYRRGLLKLAPVSDALRIIFENKDHNLHSAIMGCIAKRKRVPVLIIRPARAGAKNA
jgi:hypothetical protein